MKNLYLVLLVALFSACSIEDDQFINDLDSTSGGSLIMASSSASSSNYNHRYDFERAHFVTKHTCAVSMKNGLLAVGSTIRGFVDIRHISLTLVDPATGLPVIQSQEYRGDAYSTIAADMVPSMSNSDYVVVAGNYPPYSQPNIGIVVFETDPKSGFVNWATHFGDPNNNFNSYALARNERQGIYYLLGEYDYVANNQGFREMYVCAFDRNGQALWEKHYRDPINEANQQSADIVYDPEKNTLNIIAKMTKGFDKLGVVIANIRPDDGQVINAFRITEIGGNPDFRVKDAIELKGRHTLVGTLNESKKRSFLFQFDPSQKPNTSTASIYSTEGRNLDFIGVKLNHKGQIYASMDVQQGARIPETGLAEFTSTGLLKSSYVYQVPDYDISTGLFTTYDQSGMILKGITGYQEENHLLSIVGTRTPLKHDEDICSRDIRLIVDKGHEVEDYELKAIALETSYSTEMLVNTARPSVRDCGGE
ncbi:MAG: hypothetical protein AAFX87_18075 [Bacteroidota bacterium]